jgi:hypothetical protein
MAASTEHTDFGPPFDYTDGDVYLRSADGVHFRVHKAYLSLACVTFREMFASGDADTQRNGLPIVQLLAPEEGKAAVAGFLRVIYPVGHPSWDDDITLIRRVLELGRKYQADAVRTNLEPILRHHPLMKSMPLTFYAIACAYRMESVARASALECVIQGLDRVVRQLDQREEILALNNVDLYRLHEYRDRCSRALESASSFSCFWLHYRQEVLDYRLRSGMGLPAFLQEHAPDSACLVHLSKWDGTEDALCSLREWWVTYLKSCAKELKETPLPELVKSGALTGEALLFAGMCDQCREHGAGDFQESVDIFEMWLNQNLHQVSRWVVST